MHLFVVKSEDAGQRLDVFLSDQLGVSRSQVKKLIKTNLVTVNGSRPKKAGEPLKSGEPVAVEEATLGVAETSDNVRVKVIAETANYLIIDKPSGLLVHASKASEPNTLAGLLLQRYPQLQGVGEDPQRPGLVHRLDKEASGLMVIAKTQPMFYHLKKQFQERQVEKEYAVLVHGAVAADHDIIDFAIDRGANGWMVARPGVDTTKLKNVGKEQPGRAAITEFWVEQRFTRFTLLTVKTHTGRTHQIRVHLLAYGHPVVGDELYYNKKLNRKRDQELGRLFLHARKLCFEQLEGARVCYEIGLPEELREFMAMFYVK